MLLLSKVGMLQRFGMTMGVVGRESETKRERWAPMELLDECERWTLSLLEIQIPNGNCNA